MARAGRLSRHHWLRRRGALALGLAAALLLAGCGGGTTTAMTAPAGEPQPGGALTMLNGAEPNTLDPAQFNNNWTTHGAIGNAIYGQLLVTDIETGEMSPMMVESLTTSDGTAWTLKLRAGLVFSDGTPLDAAAVKFNWDRMKDPKVAASPNIAPASGVTATTVIDAQTLGFTVLRPTFQFHHDITTSAMNWIASPTALAAGPEAFTREPVGAGPFTVTSWVRGDRMVLARNPTYWDAPRPYLDGLVLRADGDAARRLTTVQAGEAEMTAGTAHDQIAVAEASGLVVTRQRMSGATLLMFNTVKAPFDDIRARQAMSMALDWEANNQALWAGKAEVPATLMTETSPFYEPDLTLPKPDRARAQQLFDELAAEGKPVRFTLMSTGSADAVKLTQSVQAQLAGFGNVTAEVQAAEFSGWLAALGSGQWEASVYGVPILDPEPQLGRTVASDSLTNFMRISDPELDAAIAAGRLSADPTQRKAAYRIVQQKVIELVPFLCVSRPAVAMISTSKVGGVELYANGSPRFDTVWLQQNG